MRLSCVAFRLDASRYSFYHLSTFYFKVEKPHLLLLALHSTTDYRDREEELVMERDATHEKVLVWDRLQMAGAQHQPVLHYLFPPITVNLCHLENHFWSPLLFCSVFVGIKPFRSTQITAGL